MSSFVVQQEVSYSEPKHCPDEMFSPNFYNAVLRFQMSNQAPILRIGKPLAESATYFLFSKVSEVNPFLSWLFIPGTSTAVNEVGACIPLGITQASLQDELRYKMSRSLLLA